MDGVKTLIPASVLPLSPKRMSSPEGNGAKMLHVEGIHTRHSSVSATMGGVDVLVKGAFNLRMPSDLANGRENAWSPESENFNKFSSIEMSPACDKPNPTKGPPSQFKENQGTLVKVHACDVEKLPDTRKKHGGIPLANGRSMDATNGMPISVNLCGNRGPDDEPNDYDSGYENASVSSFDFHRERAAHRSVVAAMAKPAPSKWDDAEKWLVSAPSGDRSKVKNGVSQPQALPSHALLNAGRKASMLAQQQGRPVKPAPNNMSTLHQHMLDMPNLSKPGLKPDDGLEYDTSSRIIAERTKKIDVAKFTFMPSPSAAPKARSMSSLDCYPIEDLVGIDLSDTKDVRMSPEALRTEKPTSDFPVFGDNQSSFDLNKNDALRTPISPHEPNPYAPNPYAPPPGLRSVSMRDMGTEMTPIASQEPSRTGTPLRATTPTIRSPVCSRPSTPGRAVAVATKDDTEKKAVNVETNENEPELSEKELHAKTRQEILALGAQLGKANITAWASREEEEEDASKSLKNIDLEEVKKNMLESKAIAWEEAEKSKYMARYKRDEAKIAAWENHEKAKAEAEMRRIEVKIERMRAHAHENLMNKLAATHRRAEEQRAAAEARRSEHASKTTQQVEFIRQTGSVPPSSSSSSCFSYLCRLFS